MEESRASRDFFPRKGNTASEGVKSVVNSYSVHGGDGVEKEGRWKKTGIVIGGVRSPCLFAFNSELFYSIV